jgi:small subunit ribosomal protein S6
MNRKYEIVLFLSPDLDDGSISLELEEIDKLIAKANGTSTNKSTPRITELGYMIKKKKKAYLILIDVDIDPASVKELDREMRLRENILRHTIIVKREAKVKL